jgi:cytochrome o ubiquinol oxidase operon protein cyoD
MKDKNAYHRKLRLYRGGLLLAIVLTVIPTALAHWKPLGARATGYYLLLFAAVQIIVHLRCFLDLGLRRSTRDRLALVSFATLIIGLMVGGTLVVFFDQMQRM